MGGGTGRTKGRRGGGSGYRERLEDGAAWGRGRRQPGGGKWGYQPGWAPGPQVCTIRFAIKLKIFQPGPPRSCVSHRRWGGGEELGRPECSSFGPPGWIWGSLGPPSFSELRMPDTLRCLQVDGFTFPQLTTYGEGFGGLGI